MKLILIFASILLSIVSFSQANSLAMHVETASGFSIDTLDYSDLELWAAHPLKKDPSDSVPAVLKSNYNPDSTTDIFYIHPTSYTQTEKTHGWNADLSDTFVNNKTDSRAILYQASIFNEAGRIFAPRYRQAHISAYYTYKKDSAILAFEHAYTDVKNAFEYYMQFYNKGRPIVIASHSQGTTHAKRLLKEYFDGKPLQSQLVVAYLVGMAVEKDFFINMQPCIKPDQTGCICSWRTYRENYKPAFIEKEDFNAIVTNPLSWDEDRPEVKRSENKGAILYNFNKVIPHVVNASVNDQVIWVNKPHFLGSILLKTKNYHIADYNFYYLNIRENVLERVHSMSTQKNTTANE